MIPFPLPDAMDSARQPLCGGDEAVQSQEVEGLLLSSGEQQQLHACTSDAHMLLRSPSVALVLHY
jgi:hypothetical protein